MKKRAVCSPYDGSIVGEIEESGSETLEHAITSVQNSFAGSMRQLTAKDRAQILFRVSEAITANAEELAKLIALEGGKPLKDARIEVSRAALTAKISADEALKFTGHEVPMDLAPGSNGNKAHTIRTAIGPVLAISAFNHPLNLLCHQICPAIAVGNSVIVKPASQTPLTCLKLAEFFFQAGLPQDALKVVICQGSAIEKIASDPRIRYVSFIGSDAVGWRLRSVIAPGTRLGLELGGVSAAIIEADADFSIALPQLLRSAFYHSGQVCISTQTAYINHAVYEKFTADFTPLVKNLRVGNPTDPQTDLGPIISESEISRISEAVNAAISKGAKALTGATRHGNCYAPTLLVQTTPTMTVRSQEIFGPVLNLVPYEKITAVIDEINSSPYGFHTAIYSKNTTQAHKLAELIESKAVMINQGTAFRVDWMPFGGIKRSGLGVGGVRYSMEEMSYEKLICQLN